MINESQDEVLVNCYQGVVVLVHVAEDACTPAQKSNATESCLYEQLRLNFESAFESRFQSVGDLAIPPR